MHNRPLHRRLFANRAIFAAAVGITCFALAVPASAALYKWLDANGHVVYSDIPPTADLKAERMNGPSPPANPNAVKEMANQEADLKKRQLQRTEDARKSEKTRAEEARRQDSCAQARGQIKALQTANVQYYRYNDRGERTLMDEAMRAKERDRLESYVHERCPA